jgi:hypothetical protein
MQDPRVWLDDQVFIARVSVTDELMIISKPDFRVINQSEVSVGTETKLERLKEFDKDHRVLCTGFMMEIALTVDGLYVTGIDESNQYTPIVFEGQISPELEQLRLFDNDLYVEIDGVPYQCGNSYTSYNPIVTRPYENGPAPPPFKNTKGIYMGVLAKAVFEGTDDKGLSRFTSFGDYPKSYTRPFRVIDYVGYENNAMLITDEGGVYDIDKDRIVAYIELPKRQAKQPTNGLFWTCYGFRGRSLKNAIRLIDFLHFAAQSHELHVSHFGSTSHT